MEVRRYESVVVFNPRLNDAQLKEEIKKVETILNSNNAKITGVDQWGKKELAYSFQKQKFGFCVAFNYEAANHEAPNALQSILRITDSVHKFQTHLIRSKTRKFKGNPKRLTQPRGEGEDFDFGAESFE
jgi:small subunit ribosomal protein S6